MVTQRDHWPRCAVCRKPLDPIWTESGIDTHPGCERAPDEVGVPCPPALSDSMHAAIERARRATAPHRRSSYVPTRRERDAIERARRERGSS